MTNRTLSGGVACAWAGGGVPPSAPVAAGVIQRAMSPAGRQISERCLRHADGGASRLRPPGPPPSRNWYARRLTVAPRGTPPPAQAPRVWSKPTTTLALALEVPWNCRDAAARWPGGGNAHPHRAARRARCGVPRGARRRAAGVAFQKLRRAGTSTGRKARLAKPRELTPKAAGPREVPLTQCRPPRVARSRGAPQRGRRAGDS